MKTQYTIAYEVEDGNIEFRDSSVLYDKVEEAIQECEDMNREELVYNKPRVFFIVEIKPVKQVTCELEFKSKVINLVDRLPQK